MKEKIIEGLFGEGGLLRVRALLAEAMVIGGIYLLGTETGDPALAVSLIFSGAGVYGIQRAGANRD